MRTSFYQVYSKLCAIALKGMGAWLKINGEAIYGTTVWQRYGEGPSQLGKSGAFNEKEVPAFTGQDIRFTVKGDDLYAICLGWPGEQITIQTLGNLRPAEVRSVRMLGSDQTLDWSLTPEGLTITTPSQKPCEHAYAFKINRGHPFKVSQI
jgi:alpha-L-fucosidase